MILQPKDFVAKVLPDEFKSAKYSSFTRKLHRWGFMRHYRGPDAGAFFHKHFQKGRLDLVEKMSCYKPVQTSSGNTSSRKGSYSPPTLPEPAPINTGVSGEEPINSMSAPPMGDGTGAGNFGANNGTLGGGPQQIAMQQQNGMQQQGLGQMPFSLDGQHDLNAAIELEVARRLKERINAANAAALSRQTMLVMPQQQGGFDTRYIYPTQANAAMGQNAGGGFPNMMAAQNAMGGQGFPQQAGAGFGGAQGFKPMFDPAAMQQYGMFNDLSQQAGDAANNADASGDNNMQAPKAS